MEATDAPFEQSVVRRQRTLFSTGVTQKLAFRLERLAALRDAIVLRENDVLDALERDLGKPRTEGLTSETALVLHEIDQARKHLRSWARPRKVRTPLILFPATSWVRPEPYGTVLVMSPWNYPFQLALLPIVGALAAGNCAVLKPSEVAPSTSRVIADLIGAVFDPGHCTVVEGGVEKAQGLLDQRFDAIFFTGSARAGRAVMAAAAVHLTPVTLELGGKNPCIVDADADLEKAARRIAWGKFLNAGQSCIAPDFVVVHDSCKSTLLRNLSASVGAFFGADPIASPDFGRIVSDRHFARVVALMREGTIAVGGQTDAGQRYIAPTIIDDVSWSHPAMEEEIFGPILPLLGFSELEEVIERLRARPKPLGLYYFSDDRARQDLVLERLPSGGACINDTFVQVMNSRLPFGGVKRSGYGRELAREGIREFVNVKTVWVG
jgi:acyl-CoA reductase-like NAD-dependent aldehyde dehydrogenase